MTIPDNFGDSHKVWVSGRPSLVDPIQQIALRTWLDRALRLVADCFDNLDRQARPGSVFAQQAEACETAYASVEDHKTTLVYTKNHAKGLVHSCLDHLNAAANASLDAGSGARWPSFALTRSLIEASAECRWLVDPDLDLDTRLRRTNQLFVRACHEMVRTLPEPDEAVPRFVSADPVMKAKCLNARDSALKWAQAQGWQCRNGKAITRARWIGELPSRLEMVAVSAEGAPAYSKDVYSMLSGVVHSQPLFVSLSAREDPTIHLDRALLVLDIGIGFYTNALKTYANFMGWDDHDIDDWFGPVHATLHHMRFPTEIPLPAERVEPDQCKACPDYQAPFMHRIALVSHLCALLEQHVQPAIDADSEAPLRYTLALEFFDKMHQTIAEGSVDDPRIQKLHTEFGSGHAGVLSLLGLDPTEMVSSAAASWAVLGAPSYRNHIGFLQGWVSKPDDQAPLVPYANE